MADWSKVVGGTLMNLGGSIKQKVYQLKFVFVQCMMGETPKGSTHHSLCNKDIIKLKLHQGDLISVKVVTSSLN